MEAREQSILTRRSFLAGSAVAAAMAGMTFTGCAQQGASSASGSSSSQAPSDSAASSNGSEEAPALELTAACAFTSTNPSPVGNTSALMLAANWHVFEGLYDLDLHTYKPYNGLAAGQPEKISDTEYHIVIRDEAMFSDGTPVTAEDVVNACALNMANPTYGEFLSFIQSAEALDDKTVSLILKYPFDNLLRNRLSLVKVFPARMSEDELKAMPIGSGPWMYEEINGVDGGTISFVPNPYYNGVLKATASAMRWSIMLDGAERAAALRDSKVQVIENVPMADAEALKESKATVEYVLGFNQAFLMFNCLKAPFNDRRVRQAFFYAINTDKLISDIMYGHARPVTGFLPKTNVSYHEASTVYTYDPAKARELLADAGIESLEFEMLTSNAWVKDLAAQIQEDLAEVGITMVNKETQIDWTSLAPNDNGQALPFDVMLAAGDPACFGNDADLLMSWWYGDNVWTQGRSCWAKVGDGKFEELQVLLQRGREATGAAQQEIWNQCFDLISEEVPLYALFHRELATGYQNAKISGFDPIGTTGVVFLGVTPLG